jgi:mRNA interferase MazF
MVKSYIPKRGDIVWTNFDPAAGDEQKDKRPAIILSPSRFNKMVSLALAAPITNRVRGHVFEVVLDNPTFKIKGVIMCQQIKMIDFKKRGLTFIENAPGEILNQALAKVRSILK